MTIELTEICLVTGLPRSGTSLCMSMLEAGGMPVLTDGQRTADADNPNGYYEYEPVKRTRDDPTWLNVACGKAVKMVYRLLYDLPEGFTYCTLFMRRDLDEILTSQRKMLVRKGRPESEVSDNDIRRLFQQELRRFTAWIHTQPHFHVLEVDYNELLDSATPVLIRINEFLGNRLDVTAMHQIIDPALYRNRRLSPTAT